MKMEIMTSRASNCLRLDPRTKLLLLLVINLVMMGGGIKGAALVIRPVLAALPFILLLTEGKIKAAVIYMPLFAMAAFGESFLVPHTTGVMNLLTIIASGLITRFMPCLVMGYYVVTATTVSEFTASMERMNVSPKIIIPFSVMFRFFPTVAEEAGAISDCMRMRGIGGSSIIKNPIAALEYRVVPLMVCTVKIGEELSAAALTRGLGSPVKRTNICRIGFHWQDMIFVSVAVAAAICVML
jgi:energy-coupling factor transport system permease protein